MTHLLDQKVIRWISFFGECGLGLTVPHSQWIT
jgi:hypothetical protein